MKIIHTQHKGILDESKHLLAWLLYTNSQHNVSLIYVYLLVSDANFIGGTTFFLRNIFSIELKTDDKWYNKSVNHIRIVTDTQ